MKELVKLSALIAIISIPSLVFSQEARIFSNEFLSIGLGARAQGMGNSYVATTNDVYSLYWNPAGLAEVETKVQLAYKHAEYFAGIANYDFAGLAIKTDSTSTLAFGIVRFGVDDIPNTLYLVEPDGTINYDNITYFSVADYAFFGSYGKRIGDLQLGGSAKVVHRRVGPFATAWGFGLDFGAKYHLSKNLTIGAMGRDITTTFNAWNITLNDDERRIFEDTGNDIPENSMEITMPKILIGLNYHDTLFKSITLQSEIGMDFYFDGKRNALISSKLATIEPHLGFEFGINDLFFIRGGIGNFQNEEIFDPSQSGQILTFQPNVGAGFKLKYFVIDYAYTNIGAVSGAPYSHLISLRFDMSNDVFAKNMTENLN